MKHCKESWKYDAQRSIFGEFRGVSSSGETLCRIGAVSKKNFSALWAPPLDPPLLYESFIIDDGHESENVTFKMNLRFFKHRRVYFQFAENLM